MALSSREASVPRLSLLVPPPSASLFPARHFVAAGAHACGATTISPGGPIMSLLRLKLSVHRYESVVEKLWNTIKLQGPRDRAAARGSFSGEVHNAPSDLAHCPLAQH
jgi:hypothetical protein